jgi:hypothetical protein
MENEEKILEKYKDSCVKKRLGWLGWLGWLGKNGEAHVSGIFLRSTYQEIVLQTKSRFPSRVNRLLRRCASRNDKEGLEGRLLRRCASPHDTEGINNRLLRARRSSGLSQ